MNDPLSEAAGSINNKQIDKSETYNDLDLMPFGIHKGTVLQDVPVQYLHYLWIRKPLSDRRLEAYIKKSLSALKQEQPDLLW